MPGKYEFVAVSVRTMQTLEPYLLVNTFLVGIERFLRAQYLITNITGKPGSTVNRVSVFP